MNKQRQQRSMTDDTEIHYRSDTMVEHKEESALEFDRMSQTNSTHYMKRERQGTVDTVASIESVNTVNTVNTAQSPVAYSQQGSMSPHGIYNLNGSINATIPENAEIALVSHISKLEVNQKSDDNEDNQLNDHNIDDQMYSYNKRPILFVLISIIIIYLPILTNYDIVYIFYIHLIYLIINLIMFMILIPLYSKCIPESTDSIISNGGKLLNRRPPIRYHANHNNVGNVNNNDDDDEYGDDSIEIGDVNSCHILYSFDSFYNRFFNIRNISYDVGNNVVNFDSKIYNLIAIPFAGGFLILSNIILLLCFLMSDQNDSNHILFIMRNQVTFLISSSMIIVSLTLFCQISVHFTQIKDDRRKNIGNDVYVTRLESNVQNLTEKKIFHKTLTQKLIYGMTLILSVVLWIIYYEIYNTELYQSNFATNFNLFILMLYTIILIHLVFRLLILYNYAIIIVKQFCHPIGIKTMHQVITYWDLRRYYVDLVLYAFISLFNRILTAFLLFIAITLIYIYASFEMVQYSQSNIPSNYLPIFIIIVYIMFATLYTLNIASNIHILQLKHAQMLNREKIYFKHFQYVSNFNDEMKKVMKSDDIISLINDIESDILNSTQYQIAGIIINNTSDVLIRSVFIIFAIVIYSYFI